MEDGSWVEKMPVVRQFSFMHMRYRLKFGFILCNVSLRDYQVLPTPTIDIFICTVESEAA
jgi:hypothetical protein